jgi:hypothetical protein
VPLTAPTKADKVVSKKRLYIGNNDSPEVMDGILSNLHALANLPEVDSNLGEMEVTSRDFSLEDTLDAARTDLDLYMVTSKVFDCFGGRLSDLFESAADEETIKEKIVEELDGLVQNVRMSIEKAVLASFNDAGVLYQGNALSVQKDVQELLTALGERFAAAHETAKEEVAEVVRLQVKAFSDKNKREAPVLVTPLPVVTPAMLAVVEAMAPVVEEPTAVVEEPVVLIVPNGFAVSDQPLTFVVDGLQDETPVGTPFDEPLPAVEGAEVIKPPTPAWSVLDFNEAIEVLCDAEATPEAIEAALRVVNAFEGGSTS